MDTTNTPTVQTPHTDNLPLSRRERALETVGATREKAYKTMVEGLSATSISLDRDGGEHEMPDNNARLKAAELISKLHGDMKEAVVPTSVVGSVTINISTEKMEEFTQMLRGVREELAGLTTSGKQTGEVVDAEFTEAQGAL